MFDLHIFNGDCAFELWKKCGFSGPALVWRETYLEGPLPDTGDLHTFRIARSEYLATFEELASVDPASLYRHLQKMDDTLLGLSANQKLMLWFDSCIFDQTMLMRILYLLHRKGSDRPAVFLYCCRGNVLASDDFQKAKDQKVLLSDQDLQLARLAWQHFQCRNGAGLTELSEQGNFEHFPQLPEALRRCAEEFPDSDGLSRTERQILQLLGGKKLSFQELFSELKKMETLPFLGDTACKRILDKMLRLGRLLYRNQYYSVN